MKEYKLDEKVLDEIRELCYISGELNSGIQAKKSLDEGFVGMGHNILTESASKISYYQRKLKNFHEGRNENLEKWLVQIYEEEWKDITRKKLEG
jgi:hypothetical protein